MITPLFKKLNFKGQEPIVILNAPRSFDAELDALAPFTRILDTEKALAPASFMLVFVTQQSEVNYFAGLLAPLLAGDGILWFCYPKGSSKKYSCNFNRDTGWNALAAAGFEPVRMVAIDAAWSALRFRKVQYIKTMTRSFALTEAGKAKTARTKGTL